MSSVHRASSYSLTAGVLAAIAGVWGLGNWLLERPGAATPPAPLIVAPAELPSPARSDPAPPRWILRGRIAIPDGAPEDPSLAVVARPRGPDPSFQPWRTANEPPATEGGAVRAPVASDGSFRLDLPPHWKVAWVQLDGRFLYDTPLRVSPERDQDGLLLRPRLGAWIRGTIVEAGGEPLEPRIARRARVAALPELGLLRTASSRGELEEWVVERLRSRPDDRGRFELRGLPPEAPWLIAALAEGRLPGTPARVVAQPGEPLDLRLELNEGRTMAGLVADPAGRPLEGVAVRYRGDLEQDGFGPLFGPWGVETTTDSEGRFRLAGLPPLAGVRLMVGRREGPPLARITADLTAGDAVGLTCTLPSERVVVGRVRWPDGSPAPGFDVVVTSTTDPSQPLRRSRTEKDGSFRIEGCTPAPDPLEVWIEGTEALEPGHARVGVGRRSLAGDEDQLHFVLETGRRLEALVVSAAGEALEAFDVELRPPLPGAPRQRISFEGAAGRVRLDGLSAGAWEVRVRAPGFVPSAPRSVELPAQGLRDAGVFELVRTGAIAGIVRTPEGEPLAGARLVELAAGRGEGNRAPSRAHLPALLEWRSDAWGRFEVTDLAPGAHVLVATASGFAPSPPLEVLVPAGGRVEGLSLGVRAGGRLDIVLVDAEDRPLADRFVSVARTDFLAARTARTDREGGASFERLEPGRWRVWAIPPNSTGTGIRTSADGLFASAEVEILDGELTRVVLGGSGLPLEADPAEGSAEVVLGQETGVVPPR